MLTKIKVLLYVHSNISQNPEEILESTGSFGGLKILPSEGNYKEIEEYTKVFRLNKIDSIFQMVNKIPFQFIADEITKHFDCPSVYVQHPKVTSRGIFVTYCRGELERNMLFLKIVFEEPE